MAETTAQTKVKNAYDLADQRVDEQSILDKFNAVTRAQYDVQREQNRQAENQFYNQMYNTQKTAMDTIRQANAAAVSTGASRGVQAANELSALLGLEQESVASATELAQANRQTAQEETAAVLENVLNAYQQAQQEKSQSVQQTIEQGSVDSQDLQTWATTYVQALANGDAVGAGHAWQMLQQLNQNNINTVPVQTPTTQTPNTEAPSTEAQPILKSGRQADGSLAFNTGDLNNKNYSAIQAALQEYGYTDTTFKNDLLNLYDTEEYDKIKQVDLDKSTQKGEAGNYIRTLIADEKAGKIPVGASVNLNYGNGNGLWYIYLGNGKFIPADIGNTWTGNQVTATLQNNLYVPEGYQASDVKSPNTGLSGSRARNPRNLVLRNIRIDKA